MTTSFAWCKLTTHGVLRFEGADALAFLQGQLTNDVAALTTAQSQYSGYCTPKGRLLASMLVWREGSEFCMLLPRELCEPLRKRLSMYILRSKVTARDVSESVAVFGTHGAQAVDRMVSLAGTAPAADHQAIEHDGVTVIQLPVHRYLIVADIAVAGKCETALSQLAAPSVAALWTRLDIEAGIAQIVTATQDAFVPQMVNFDLINAVSFSKGCYPGQEIVARTHYLGRIKQRMLRARVVSDQLPAPGDKLYSPTYGEQACGTIVSAAQAEAAHCEVLAVTQVADLAQTAVYWRSKDGPVLQFGDLPYSVA